MIRNKNKERPYLVLTVSTLVFVGGGIIGLVYGMNAFLAALPFLLLGALMISGLWLLVTAIARWRERTEREYHTAAARHVALQAEKEKEKSGADDPGG
jgi:ABC-type uncharacterized transport system permease subunit